MTESADSQLTSLSMIGCRTKLVPARFSNSFKAVSKSDFSSGGGSLDMALKEMVRGCDGTEHKPDSHPATPAPKSETPLDEAQLESGRHGQYKNCYDIVAVRNLHCLISSFSVHKCFSESGMIRK